MLICTRRNEPLRAGVTALLIDIALAKTSDLRQLQLGFAVVTLEASLNLVALAGNVVEWSDLGTANI